MSAINFVSKTAGKVGHVLSKNAPTILTVTGVAGGVTAAVLGARAALKSQGHVAQLNDDREIVASKQAQGAFATSQEHVEALTYIWVLNGKKIVANYIPAITLGAVSIAAILWGHGMLRQRNAALIASYAALERSFATYRARVRATGPEGEKLDAAIVSDMGFVEEVDEDGNSKLIHDQRAAHLYTRVFDDKCDQWSRERDYNLYFLKVQERLLNDKLQRRGHIFLNEVLEALDFEHVPEGAITGWLKDGDGDGFIDFGMDAISIPGRAFDMSLENHFLLNFNVDGVIYDRI